MFQFKGSYEVLDLNKGAYIAALNEALAEELKNAMRAWLKAVFRRVPVYTGMARGSLLPIARFLGEQVPITPKARGNASTQLYGRRVRASPEEGARRTTFKFDSRIGRHEVTIDIGVIHYLINEFNRVSLPLRKPGPWRSFEAGRKAYKAYLKKNLRKKVPRITKFITRTKVRFGE